MSSDKPETFTQAYHAGIIIAMIENFLPDVKLPPFVSCMVNFHSLRELLGERIWQNLKTRHRFKNRIRVYEALTFQPRLPRFVIGTSRDFCIGYAKSYNVSKLKHKTDNVRRKDIQSVLAWLAASTSSKSSNL